jgi:hypothetical protein
VLAATLVATGLRIIKAPMTSKQYDPANTVALPPRVAQHLKLDPGCRVVCNDLNRLIWVGPDVRATPGGTPYYGQILARLFEEIRGRILANAVRPTDRTE